MEILRRGSGSPQVKLAQRLTNLHIKPKPKLQEDARFGPKTETAVRALQNSKKLKTDGIVGPKTWRALGVKIDISHRVKLYGQPTRMTCWSAAATMLTGTNMSYGSGGAAVGPKGGLKPQFKNVQAFAKAHGFRFHSPRSWTVQGLVELMRRGPVWVAGWVPSGHAVVYGGIHGDGTPGGTLILVYDPWPPLKGDIRGELYGDWVNKHPTATTYILQAGLF